MWIFTPIGFFSIVQKPYHPAGTLTVRARVLEDLQALREFLPELGPIKEDPQADYRFRALCPTPALARATAGMVEGITYDNFKNEVARRQGRERASLYGRVWQTLLKLQRDVAKNDP